MNNEERLQLERIIPKLETTGFEKDAEIQQLKEEVVKLMGENGKLECDLDELKSKGGATVQQIAEAWDEAVGKTKEAAFICDCSLGAHIEYDPQLQYDKSEYLKQFETKQRQEEGFKDFRIKELEKALREAQPNL
jgi:regulator of replication initiation timing